MNRDTRPKPTQRVKSVLLSVCTQSAAMAAYFIAGGCLLLFLAGASANIPSVEMNKIIGGSKTTQEDFPYQLALEGAPNGRHTCGGSVLATYWAITAAHCIYNKPLKSLAFRAGSSVRGEGGTHHPVQFYLYHDLYRRETLDYDLALVKVKVPFRFSPMVRPVTLPTKPPKPKEPAFVSGWGFLEKEHLRKPKDLMAAEVIIKSWDECKKIYPALSPRMLCAGASDVDFCSGDSGGPLTRADNMDLLGVVSWLYKCGDGLPGVYANISSMMPWIMKSLNKYGVHLHTEPSEMIMFPN